jgi:hypothetical protein
MVLHIDGTTFLFSQGTTILGASQHIQDTGTPNGPLCLPQGEPECSEPLEILSFILHNDIIQMSWIMVILIITKYGDRCLSGPIIRLLKFTISRVE